MSIRLRHAPYADYPDLDVTSAQGAELPHAIVIACGIVGFLAAARIWAPR